MANPIIYAFTRDDLRQVANVMLRSCLNRIKANGDFDTFAQTATIIHYVQSEKTSPKIEKKSLETSSSFDR